MSQVASIATAALAAKLTSSTGLAAAIGEISAGASVAVPQVPPSQIIAQNVSPEIAEKSLVTKYPAIHAYCEKVVNQLREKFRMFSGQAHMVVEVRVSQDRLDNLEMQMQLLVEAVTQVLDQNRGDWGNGSFFGGGYEIQYGPVKHGGRNLLQTAKISFVVEVSM